VTATRWPVISASTIRAAPSEDPCERLGGGRGPAAVISAFSGAAAAATSGAAHFQVYCEDPSGANGVLEYTIDDAGFMSLKNEDPHERLLLRDVNVDTR
jgi:hypothetical protein